MAGDVLLRFVKGPGDIREQIEQWTGYTVYEEPGYLVVKHNDPLVLKGPRAILATEKDGWTLSEKTYDKISSEYIANYLVNEFEEKLETPKKPISIVEAGILSDIEKAKLQMFFTRREALKEVLKTDIFPFMKGIGATRVFPLKIDFIYQQRALSMMKIALLNRKYGFEESRRRVLDHGALNSILPSANDIVNYVEILNVYAPRAIALPLIRMGSGLYFLGDQAWQFPYLLTKGIYATLIANVDPLAEGATPPIFDREPFVRYVSRRYFRLTVEAVNRLAKFLNDPRTYADGSNEADLELFVKVHCLVRLIFADLAALHLSTELHQRHRFAFSFFDKLANLRLAFHADRSEGEWFKAFLSPKHGQIVANVLRTHLDKDFAPLGRVLERMCLQTYTDIGNSIQAAIAKIPAGRDRPSVQEMLRTIRNLEHGTMLSKGVPFEDLFYHGDLEVPTGVLYLPLFFILAFCFDPLRVIGAK